jgi:hypothetical protein
MYHAQDRRLYFCQRTIPPRSDRYCHERQERTLRYGLADDHPEPAILQATRGRGRAGLAEN